MANKKFNAVEGFSVGPIGATTVIDANGNVTANFLTAQANANVGNLGTAGQIISTLATGTSPFLISSNTLIANLNADLLDGYNTDTANTGSTIVARDANGNVSANFFIGNGSQLSGIVASGATSIANGTSNVSIPVASGNVNISVGGTSNVLVVTSTGANITGTLETSGNTTVSNLIANTNIFTPSITTSATNGNLTIDPNGSGNLVISSTTPVVIANGQDSNSYALLLSGNLAATANYGLLHIGEASTSPFSYSPLWINKSANTTTWFNFTNPNTGSATSVGFWLEQGTSGGNYLYQKVYPNGLGQLSSSKNLLIDTETSGNITLATAGYGTVVRLLDNGVTEVNGNAYFYNGITANSGNITMSTGVFVGNLANGTSNIRMSSGGNVTISRGGVSNLLVVTGTGVNVAGTINSTGNTTVQGNVVANRILSSNSTGGALTIVTPDATTANTAGGAINITTGWGGTGNSGGGDINLTTGKGNGSQDSGDFIFGGGDAFGTGRGGSFNVYGGYGVSGPTGAFLNIYGGSGNTSIGGGDVYLAAGHGSGATNSPGGEVTVIAGNSAGTSFSGNISLTAGSGNYAQLGSSLLLEGGVGTIRGGDFLAQAGNANTGTDLAGGNISLSAGTGTGAGTPGRFLVRLSSPLASGTTSQTLANVIVTDYTQVNIAPTTNSTSTTSGALIVGGGVGISGNLYAGGIANITGNANVGNLGTSGTVIASTLQSNVATGTAPLVVASTTLVANLNADLLDGFNTATANTASTVALRDANGNVSANFFIGNGSQLQGVVASATSISNGTSNVSIPVASGNVNITAGGVTTLIVTSTGVNISGILNTGAGNANLGNLGFGTGVITGTGNITGGNIIGTIAAGSNTIITTGNANLGNLGFGTGIITGTGNITAGNFIGTFANGNSTISIPTANSTVVVIVGGNSIANFTPTGSNFFVPQTSVVNSSSDALRVTQVGSGNALVVEDSTNPDSTPFVISNTGAVLVGYTASVNSAAGSGVFPSLVQTTGLLGMQEAYYAADALGPLHQFLKSRNNIDGSHAIVANNDILGAMQFAGSNGSAFVYGAQISGVVDSTPSGTANDMPSRLVFSTRASEIATGPAERMRITSDGNVGIGITNPQAKLHVAQETLIESTGVSAILGITSNTGTADNNRWTIRTFDSTGTLRIQAQTDAGSGGGNVIDITRNAQNITGMSIGVNSTVDALRITQIGSGNAIKVEDQANPDSTPFLVDASGNVGIANVAPTEKLSVTGNAYVSGTVTAGLFSGNGAGLTNLNVAGGTSIVNGTSNVIVAASSNVTVGVSGTNNVLVANSTGITVAGSFITGTGNANINLSAGNSLTIAATAPPTTDMVLITNQSQNVATAGVSAMQINYVGGVGAIEASAVRVDMTPGETANSTWNAYRIAATAPAGSGVTFNGIKFDTKTAGAGNSRAIFVGTGYDDILNYNGTSVIYGNGVVNSEQLSPSINGRVLAISLGMAMP